MPVNTDALIKAMAEIADNRNIRVTLSQACKGSAVCAASAFVGGILLGPVGLAIGGTLGGCAAYKLNCTGLQTQNPLRGYSPFFADSFRPLGQVLLNDLTQDQRERLSREIMRAVADFEVTDLAMLLRLLQSNATILNIVLNTLIAFSRNDLLLKIID